MRNKGKITCPLCMTKMQALGDDFICPECGYKYCDYKSQNIYSTSPHDHSEYKSYTHHESYTLGKDASSQNQVIKTTARTTMRNEKETKKSILGLIITVITIILSILFSGMD